MIHGEGDGEDIQEMKFRRMKALIPPLFHLIPPLLYSFTWKDTSLTLVKECPETIVPRGAENTSVVTIG
jgi:hypothetical protein